MGMGSFPIQPKRLLRTACSTVFVLLLFSVCGRAQNGVITGRVSDKSGAILPGVDITLTSPAIMGERALATDEQGGYRFTLLPPGTYALKFQLPSFTTLVRQGIQITTDFTATLNVSLEVASAAESITVVGESPVVDLESAVVATTFNAQLSAVLPTAHDFWSVLGVAPGMQVTTPDVGGSQANYQSSYRTYGSSGQNWLTIDGAITTQGTSAASFYYDNDAFQEVQIAGSSKSAEDPTPGARLKFIVKTGGNQLHGLAFSDWEPVALQANNLTDALRRRGYSANNSRAKWLNFHGDLGGPFIKDKFWWYISYRNLESDLNVIGFKTPTGQTSIYPANLQNESLKLQYQLTPKNTLTYSGQYSRKYQPYTMTVPTSPYFDTNSAGIQEEPAWTNTYQVTSVLTPKATLETRVAEFGWVFPRKSRVDEISRRDLDTLQVRGGYSGDSTGFNTNTPFADHTDRWHAESVLDFSTSGSPFGSHNIKLGYAELFNRTPYTNYGTKDSIVTYWRGGFARPALIETYNTPLTYENAVRQRWLFINDTWNATKKLTLNLGFRWDQYHPYYPEQGTSGLGPYQQKVTYPRFDFPVLNGPVPRLSAIYDVFGNGRTAIKASFGIYAYNTGAVLAGYANPNSPLVKRYNWDGTLPYVPDPKQLVATINGPSRKVDPNLKLPTNPEYTAGIDQQIMTDMVVRFNFVRKFERNRWQVLNTAIPYSAYDIPVIVTDPGRDGIAGTADDRKLAVFNLEPKYKGLRSDLLTNDPGFAGDYTTYGVELVKRFSRKWQVVSGLDIAHYKTWANADIETDTTGFAQNPNNRIYNAGLNYWHRQFKVLGSYDLRYGITASGSLRVTRGEPYGRQLNTPSLNQGVQVLTVEPIGTFFYPPVKLLDLRFSKTFQLGERAGKVEALMDLFNIFNSAAILAATTQTGASFGRPTQTLPPMISRLGVRWSF